MKRWLTWILCAALLTGCGGKETELGRGLALRSRMLSKDCGFTAVITASYMDRTHSFTMDCTADVQGNVSFTVTQPESIAGISGTLGASGGKLTFDDTALSFGMLADGEVSPISSPWLLVHTLRSGYLNASGMEGEYLRLTIDDSYEEEALQLDIWLDASDIPQRAEILWHGRRVVTIEVDNFSFV